MIIGVDMYGLADDIPKEELSDWPKSVLKPIEEIPHIVAHEIIHFQQKYNGGNLLKRSIKEGATDFIGELIFGRHINEHVHEFADKKKAIDDILHINDFEEFLKESKYADKFN